METAFSGWNKSKRGSTANSEDEKYSCTLYKDENGRLMCIINENDGLTNPRLITLVEMPEVDKQPGSPRKEGEKSEYFFLRGSRRAGQNKYEVFRGNLFVKGVPRLIVSSSIEEDITSSEEAETEA